MSGRIFNIQRCCIHDGPGIRTTVFFKGCPLRCAWCHNPEGVTAGPILSFLDERCIGCGYCFRTCQHGGHAMEDGKHVLRRENCIVCGACAAECYAGAIELIGRETSVDQVMREVVSDRPFYETSGGGMTLSGGEPLMQLDFAIELLTAARRERIHCAVETCGHVPWKSFEFVLPLVDLFLYDLKDADDDSHRRNTGVGNQQILANLRTLHDRGAAIELRIPLIPGHNSSDANLRGLIELIRSMPKIRGVEVMPYHRLGEGKLKRLGLPQPNGQIEPPPDELVSRWRRELAAALART